MSRQIEITLNGNREIVPVNTFIAHLIANFEERDQHLIVEHNGRFVYPQHYTTTQVREGDEIEFINPNFGG
jgi:thiamine biosynthesis protein ThiS